jgi:co-chaperonin GroES (HSP10)
MNIRPIGGKVYVELQPEPETTAGGIAIPDHLRDRQPVARVKVLSVGAGHVTRSGAVVPCEVKPGDVALMPWRVGADQGRRRVVPEAELIGVIT